MNRLDEIKERFNRWKDSGPLDPEEIYEAVLDNAPADIEYLLNEVERYRTALESVYNAPAREIMRKYAEKALKEE